MDATAGSHASFHHPTKVHWPLPASNASQALIISLACPWPPTSVPRLHSSSSINNNSRLNLLQTLPMLACTCSLLVTQPLLTPSNHPCIPTCTLLHSSNKPHHHILRPLSPTHITNRQCCSNRHRSLPCTPSSLSNMPISTISLNRRSMHRLLHELVANVPPPWIWQTVFHQHCRE
jgi:hypothetical protein